MIKKKMLLAFAVVLCTVALVAGGTFAIFTDNTSTGDVGFVAGSVDIDSYRDGFDTIPGPMFYTTEDEGATPTNPSFKGLKPTGFWAPGDTHIRSLIVYNQGSLDAILDKIRAEIISDPSGMSSQMNVGVYKILPTLLPNGTPFAPLPGDDCIEQDLLDHTSSLINPFILMSNWFFPVTDLAQELIEQQIPITAELLWSGDMDTLIATEQPLNKTVTLKSIDNPFIKRGCLLAFVVQMDRSAGNIYQDKVAKFGFTVQARQSAE